MVWALGVLLALVGGEARAELVTITLFWPGGPAGGLAITPGSPFAQPGSINTSLTLNTAVLNTFLAANGSALQFSAGAGASSNWTGAADPAGATLSQNGTLTVLTVSTGSTTMTIDASLQSYTTPNGTTGTVQSSGAAAFINTGAGDTQTFNSWYDGNNALNGKTIASGLETWKSTGPDVNSPSTSGTSKSISAFTTPFSLTNEIAVTLTNTGLSGESDLYQGSTKVLDPAGLPEPASAVMLLTGMSLLLVGYRAWRSRNAGSGPAASWDGRTFSAAVVGVRQQTG
jgi:hypothetical protein